MSIIKKIFGVAANSQIEYEFYLPRSLLDIKSGLCSITHY